ncbi:hypothetical protein VE02_06665 [Pseudogymnoascus sp. 03VT05]|nr:hypothetical protein VE02_06665 [Pseudogymnoascus sp. 03VT05]
MVPTPHSRGQEPLLRSIGSQITDVIFLGLYYSAALAQRESGTDSIPPPQSNLATGLKLRLNPKTPQKPKPQPQEAPAVLTESNKGKDSEESDDDIPLKRKSRKPIQPPKVSARVNNSVTAVLGEQNGDKNNKESKGGVPSAPTKIAVKPVKEKSAETLEGPAPTSLKDIRLAPAETSAERAARLRREVAEKSKALEDLQRMQTEAAEQAIAEEEAEAKKAAEKRASAKADAEEAAAKEVAAELAKAGAESNRKAVNKSLKCCAEIAKYAISTYLTQQKAEATDKTLVAKWDKELAGYCSGALEAIASEPQKRKFKEGSEDKRSVKAAKK